MIINFSILSDEESKINTKIIDEDNIEISSEIKKF